MARLTNRDAVEVADKHAIEGDLRSAFLYYWVCDGDRELALQRLAKLRREQYEAVRTAFEKNEARIIELFCEAANVEAERIGVPEHLKSWLDKPPYSEWTEEEKARANEAFQALSMLDHSKAEHVAKDLARGFRELQSNGKRA